MCSRTAKTKTKTVTYVDPLPGRKINPTLNQLFAAKNNIKQILLFRAGRELKETSQKNIKQLAIQVMLIRVCLVRPVPHTRPT